MRAIARKFKIKPRRIIPVQNGVYRLILRNGKAYCLKRMPVSTKKLRWIDQSLQFIRKKGFNRIGWRNPYSKEGKRRFVSHGRFSYILTPWILGRWPSPTSSSDMRACGAALARFHQASTKNYHLRNHSANMVGKWPADFREKHIFLSKQAEKVFLKKQVGEILKYSKQTLKSLKKHNYQKVCRAHPKRSVLCHGDGGPTNFIINKKGIHLIDFETLRIDLRAYDLYRMIYNSCKDHGWKFEIAKNILEGYQSISKLKKVDFRMISVLLRFPQTTYLLFRSLRHQKNHRKSVAIQALQAERKVSAFIKKLDRFSRK